MIERLTTRFGAPTSLRLRFGRGVMFSIVASIFNSGSTFLINIIVANLLGRETFGEIAMVQSTLLTVSTVASLATGITATKYVAEFRSIDRDRTARILGYCSAVSLLMGATGALLCAALAPWLAGSVLKSPQLATGFVITAIIIFFNVHNYYQIGALAGLEDFAGISKAAVLAGTSYLFLCMAGAYWGGRQGVFVGLALSAGTQWLALSFFLRKERMRQRISIDYRHWASERSILLNFSFPAALSGFTAMPALWAANALLVRQPGGYAQMALYAAATNLRVITLILPQLINNVAMSLLNNAKGLGHKDRYVKVYLSNLWLTTGITVVCAVAMVVLGPRLLAFFGRSFDEGYPVLLILMVATIFESLMQANYLIVQSTGKMWLSLLAIAVPRDLTIVVVAYALTPVYGAVGLALGYAVGWAIALLGTAILAVYLLRRVEFHSPSLALT